MSFRGREVNSITARDGGYPASAAAVSCWKCPISCSLRPISTPWSSTPLAIPALDALDEPAVLDPDLRVERHEVVDPRRVDVRAEEVVEEAVRPAGRQRDHRADRDVRLAGEDVHAEVRPEEVELRALELALDVDAGAHRPALAREPAVGRERVRVGRGVDQLRERGVGDLAVVALEEVLADDLPVRVDVGDPAEWKTRSSTSSPSSATCAGIDPSASASGSGLRRRRSRR